MKLNLYDIELNRIAIIGEQFVSCLWTEGYNTPQSFTLELQETPEYRAKVKPDYYIGRDDRKTLMVIKTVQFSGGRVIASGKQATRVLDDVIFVGTIPAGSRVTSSIKNAYDQSGKFPSVEILASDITAKYPGQTSHKTILELCTLMCTSQDVGIRAKRQGKTIAMEFYQPEANPNLVFSANYGNLTVEGITLSTENEKNYAVVLGEESAENRVRVYVDLTGGEQKRAIIVDARDLQREEGEAEEAYHARLYARGLEKLLEKTKTWACAFTPSASDFGVRYDLGDIVTILLQEYGLKMQARITRITQKAQKNTTKTTVEVGKITIARS